MLKRRTYFLSFCTAFLGAAICHGADFASLYASPLALPHVSVIEVPAIAGSGAVLPAAARITPAGEGQKFTGKVIQAKDGDSLVIDNGGDFMEIRLAEVDTPEKAQPYGDAARAFTRRLAVGKTVTVEVRTIDAYGRRVSVVRFADGRTLNRELLKAGLAWWYRYFSDDESLGELERAARAAGLGLWADPNPVPPWDYRRQRREQGLLSVDPAEL
ncbi:MAG: thermonuclease family protein [Elusimicrobiota bacterium]